MICDRFNVHRPFDILALSCIIHGIMIFVASRFHRCNYVISTVIRFTDTLLSLSLFSTLMHTVGHKSTTDCPNIFIHLSLLKNEYLLRILK